MAPAPARTGRPVFMGAAAPWEGAPDDAAADAPEAAAEVAELAALRREEATDAAAPLAEELLVVSKDQSAI